MFDFVSFIPRAIVQGIPLLFGSTGETLTEKSGNLNLGIPGIMYVGGICGVIGAFLYEQAAGGAAGHERLSRHHDPAAVVPAWLAAHGSALLLSYRHAARQPERHRPCHDDVRRRLRQLLRRLAHQAHRQRGAVHRALARRAATFPRRCPSRRSSAGSARSSCPTASLPTSPLSSRCIAAYVLKRTRVGLHLRAVGESPQTADAAGIDVNKVQVHRHLRRQHDRRPRRTVLRHGLRLRRLVQRRLRRPRLARHRARHLHGLEAERRRARLHPLRRTVHPATSSCPPARTSPSRSCTR